jgi:hypothetical protein
MAQITNCLIFGSGRCATSALAGALAHTGVFTGYHILGPTANQPSGYFEDKWINEWNDKVIQMSDPGYRGLFITPVNRNFLYTNLPVAAKPQSYFWMRPYAIKDPRFAYTYRAWLPYLVQPSIALVLFRNPSDFVKSALRLRADFPMISEDPQVLEAIWKNNYEHILANDDGTFRYFDYHAIVGGSGRDKIEHLLGYKIDWSHIDTKLIHAEDGPCPDGLLDLWRDLRKRASSG